MNDSEQKRIFSKNLNQHLEIRGLTQKRVADRIGVSAQTFNTWCKGIAIPRMGKIQKLADYFGINKSDLIEEKKDTDGRIYIPVLGKVQAGVPTEAVQDIIGQEEVTPEMAAKGDLVCLKVNGDSMSPQLIDGDIVVVLRQDDCENGDIAVIFVNGEDATIKTIKKHNQGISLIPKNPTFETRYFTNDEIQTLPVAIYGKIIELRRAF